MEFWSPDQESMENWSSGPKFHRKLAHGRTKIFFGDQFFRENFSDRPVAFSLGLWPLVWTCRQALGYAAVQHPNYILALETLKVQIKWNNLSLKRYTLRDIRI